MRVLVTGPLGYIGSALVAQLHNRPAVDDIVLLDDFSSGTPRVLAGHLDDDLEVHRGDVREYGDVESVVRGSDTIVHLAAITGAASTHDRREETFAVNLDGTENVLRAARKHDVDRVVFASSCNVYGRATTASLDETAEADPINPYAESKLAGEELLAEYVDAYGLSGTALRMSTVYGWSPGIRFNLVVNYFVFRALTDRPLTVYGDGSNWRPFVHVDDAARAYAAAALAPGDWSHLRYNVGATEENYRVETVAEIVQEATGEVTGATDDVPVTYLEDEHPGPSYHVEFERLAETGFELEWTLPEGVCDLVDRFRAGDVDPQDGEVAA
ncbi:MAG: SDR family oxidoreductase [Haloarculaceae archaeon]